jgi:hypothetical protein
VSEDKDGQKDAAAKDDVTTDAQAEPVAASDDAGECKPTLLVRDGTDILRFHVHVLIHSHRNRTCLRHASDQWYLSAQKDCKRQAQVRRWDSRAQEEDPG